MSEIQVVSSHYDDWLRYNKKARWVSYWHQITEVLATGASSCLEIGTGFGVVRDVLVRSGLHVTTVDIDKALGVDRVGDVRDLPCGENEFDTVLCAQVLEHIPWHDVPLAVAELRRVCRTHAVVSLPQSGLGLGASMGVAVGDWLAEKGAPFRIGTPRRYVFNGQHHWEVCSRGRSRRTVRRAFQSEFVIEREYQLPEFPYHRFYVLAKKRLQYP